MSMRSWMWRLVICSTQIPNFTMALVPPTYMWGDAGSVYARERARHVFALYVLQARSAVTNVRRPASSPRRAQIVLMRWFAFAFNTSTRRAEQLSNAIVVDGLRGHGNRATEFGGGDVGKNGGSRAVTRREVVDDPVSALA